MSNGSRQNADYLSDHYDAIGEAGITEDTVSEKYARMEELFGQFQKSLDFFDFMENALDDNEAKEDILGACRYFTALLYLEGFKSFQKQFR